MCAIFIFQSEAKRRVESSNRELERNAALFKHDLKEVGFSVITKLSREQEPPFVSNEYAHYTVSTVCILITC